MKVREKTKPKSLRELIPALFESPEKKRARAQRLIALLKSPLFTEDVENDRETGKALFKALSKSRGYKI